MDLEQIEREIVAAPTMMEPDQELHFLALLMALPPDAVQADWPKLRTILERLYESHMEAFYSVDESTRPDFLRAAEWMEQTAAATTQPARKAQIAQMAEHLRM